MSDDFEDDSESPVARFPLSRDEISQLRRLSKYLRNQLQRMTPKDLRGAAAVILALERLPATTPGVQITFSFIQPNIDGNYGWADISISETELILGVGEHFYDPSVGGDTESRHVFTALAGDDFSKGDINEWLPYVRVLADGNLTADDYSDDEAIDWAAAKEPIDEAVDEI
jgi:hypothetical protein